jgi:hypothetical protein
MHLESNLGLQSILKDNMKMYVMATKLVPFLLGELQKEIVSTCQDIPESLKRDPEFFLKIMTTGDETWICECDPATNPHLSGRASSPLH